MQMLKRTLAELLRTDVWPKSVNLLLGATSALDQKPAYPSSAQMSCFRRLPTSLRHGEMLSCPARPTVALRDLTRDRLFTLFQLALLALPGALLAAAANLGGMIASITTGVQ